MIYDLTHALTELYSGYIWVFRGDPMDFKGLEWKEETTPRPYGNELLDWVNAKNAAEPMRLLRSERDKLLTTTDWWALPDRTMTAAQIAYRQALRDLPSNSTPTSLPNGNLDMTSVDWPIKP
jgi:hypothetical protein